MDLRFPRWLDPRRIYQNPGRILDPRNLRGGLVYGLGIGQGARALGVPQKDALFLESIVTAPNPVGLVTGFALHDANNPLAEGGVVDAQGNLTETAKAERAARIKRGEKDPYPNFGPQGQAQYGPYSFEADPYRVDARPEASVLPPVSPTIPPETPVPPAPPELPRQPVVSAPQQVTPPGQVAPEQVAPEPMNVPPSAPVAPTMGSSNLDEAKPGLEQVKDEMLTRAQVNARYDQLRAEDPEAAVKFGLEQHRRLYPGYYK